MRLKVTVHLNQSAFFNDCYLYSLDEHVHLLSKEIQVDFSRSMNRITFDRIVNSKPETYPFVALPQEEEEVIPERGTL